MPDLKNKYSDPELNPGNKDFDEIVNRPDMQALNDQGDSVARDLKNSEGNVKAPEDFNEGDGKDAARRAEAKEWNAPENQFNYEKSLDNKSGTQGWSRRRKMVAAGAGGGGIGAILIAGFMLLPLKVPGMMQLVTDVAGQRIEQITERRAKLILARAIMTKFGTHTGIVVTGEGAFASLIASMRTSGFEKKLAAKGITIEPTKDGVKLRLNNELIGDGKNLRSEADVLRALDGKPVTNRILKDIIKEEIPSWRWMKRAKFAKWLRIKYGVPRYGLTNSDKTDPEEKKKEMDAERAKSANSRLVSSFREILTCIMSGSCSKVNGTNEASKKAAEAEETTKDVDNAKKEADAHVEKNGLGDPQKTATKILLQKFGTKAIPIIGWIDLLATLDHFANVTIGEDDFFGKISAYYKGAAYAAVYADWAGYGSQIQEGGMDPEYVGVLSGSLDGAETAQAFQAIQGDPSKGEPISMKVNSDKPSSIKQLYETIINSPAGVGNKYVGHPILNAYYITLGSDGFLGWAGKHLGNLVGGIFSALTPDAVKSKAEELAKEALKEVGPTLLREFGLALDALDTGARLMNNIFGGAVVSTNAYGEEIGLRELSNEQAMIQNSSVAADRAEYRQQKGLMYALFSTEENTSLTAKAVVAMPTSPSSGLSSLGRAITSIPSTLASMITPRSSAAGTSYESLYNVKPFGATEADLARPLSKQFLDSEPCPDKPKGDFNDCTTDTEIAEGMLCEFESESEECSDTDPSSIPGGSAVGGEVRVASFNIFHDDPGQSDEFWKARLTRSVKVLVGNGIDVAGLQEVRPSQMAAFNTAEFGGNVYDMHPKATNGPNYSPNPIIWNKAKYKLIKTGEVPFTYFGGSKSQAPLVRLETIETGQQFYVINTHDPADARGEADMYRLENAKRYSDIMKNLAKDGIPIFFTGDFNSGYSLRTGNNNTFGNIRANLTYCILTDNTGLWDAYDAFKQLNGKCPSQNVNWNDNYAHNNGNAVDHIFLSKYVAVTEFYRSPKGFNKNGSDAHDTIIAKAVIPNKDSAGAAVGDWSWPVDKKWWTQNRSDFLDAHSANSGTWTSGINSLAVDISAPHAGSPVYAMLGGKVSNADLGGHGLVISSVVQGGTLEIAYAHGPRTNKNGTYTAGSKIMTIGNLGNSDGAHLHIDMAFNGKGVCAQDVFLAMAAGKEPDLAALTKKAVAPCGRL
jgi:murein DD-endopeptidase MepM/ murein hydrolase activator NlpD